LILRDTTPNTHRKRKRDETTKKRLLARVSFFFFFFFVVVIALRFPEGQQQRATKRHRRHLKMTTLKRR
tara:strand:- start:509 stop:715 length:207 start_codon:yes stop_codon:yes gene_type:complete